MLQMPLTGIVIVNTVTVMNVIFDTSNDSANLVKHGVSLSVAASLEWQTMMAEPDSRRDYGELRMIGYAPIGERVFCVIFVDRGDQRRIISLLKANNREVNRYASNI
jgi:uncharacterized DUF497 family protein